MRYITHWFLLPAFVVVLFSAAVCDALSSGASQQPLRFFIGGLGYCGSRLALKLRREYPDCKIAGCVRSESRKQSIITDTTSSDIQVHVLDLDQEYRGLEETGLDDLFHATHIIQTIAPIADFDRDPLLALHGETLKDSKSLRWVGYLSSTGVYGDHGGDWVDEASELKCQDAKSLARVKSEIEWRQLEVLRRENHQTTRVDCFRCGGIYGPGRGPLFSASLSSMPNTKSNGPSNNDDAPPKYVNRILVDDICNAIIAAVEVNNLNSSKYQAGKTYNLVDDDPAPRQDVIAEARRLVGNPNSTTDAAVEGEKKSTTVGANASPSRRRPTSRNTGNKRCRNLLLKEDYEWEQIAPTYREGLAYLLRQQELAL